LWNENEIDFGWWFFLKPPKHVEKIHKPLLNQ
jgi:hypothetical protein